MTMEQTLHLPQKDFKQPNFKRYLPQGISASNVPADWLNQNFKKRIPLTIQGSQFTSTHLDYPLLINSQFSDLIDFAKVDGGDIRFALPGQTELKSEIQFIDIAPTKGDLIAWAQIPSIQTGTLVYMYFNNAAATLPPKSESKLVWDEYLKVYHTQAPVPFGGPILDSTDNTVYALGGANGTPVLPGKWGNSHNHIDFKNVLVTDATVPAQSAWLSFWAKPRDITTSQYILNYEPNKFAVILGFQDPFWNFFFYPTGQPSDTVVEATINVWQKLDFVIHSGRVKIYKNGVKIRDVADQINRVGSLVLILGASQTNGVAAYNGQYQEMRLHLVDPIPLNIDDRILAEYNNQNITNNFYSIGATESI